MRSLTLAPYLTRVQRRLSAIASRLRPGRAGPLIVLAAVLASLSASPARGAALFYIRGGGAGHGIGMSQYGAYGYALHGQDYHFILGHYYQGTALGTTNPRQVVHVLLATGSASFSGASAAGHTRLNPSRTYRVRALSTGRLQITDSAGRPIGRSAAAPLTVSGSSPLEVRGVGGYRGSLQFRPTGRGGVETVNAVGLDDYVRGVVSAEMPAGWLPAALQAQAVAARTYAITTTVNGDGYDLYADTRSQVYGGVGAETPSTDAAVAATRGQIVIYGGRPADTYFFASSGGYTENIENVWPGASPEPWLRGVSDPYDGAAGDPYHRWGQQMSLGAAAAHLHGLVRGSLDGITVTRRGASPRILRASIIGTRGQTGVSGATLQSAFSLPTTYATFTVITTNASASALSGAISGAGPGSTYWVQQLQPGGWHTIAREATAAGGAYSAGVPGRGRYRIQ